MATAPIPPLQVLLVEDNPGDADLVRLTLEQAGSFVALRHRSTLEEALSDLASHATDAVLLDLHLPDAAGTEGVEALRAVFPRVPVVVLTGAAGAGLEAVSAGAQDYLSKGNIDGGALERSLRYAVERQRTQERLQELASERAARQAAESSARLLELSYRVAEAALTYPDPRECLRAIVDETRSGFETDTATLLLTSEDGTELVVEATAGDAEREGDRIPLGEGIAGSIARTGRARAVPDVEHAAVANPRLHQLASLMGAPLRVDDRTIGVLHVGSRQRRDFSQEEVRMLAGLGSRMALVVENARLRERARFEEARWRSVVETMTDMVCIATPLGDIGYVNEAMRRWAGSDAGSCAPSAATRWYRSDGSEFPADELPIPRAARGEQVREVEIVHRSEDGEERTASWSASPIRGVHGGIDAVVAIGHDVTPHKRAEQVLREADRRKDEFLAVLSHELRNPLAPIQTSLYLLDRIPADSEQARRARAIIERQVLHMTRLVGDLLDISRITRGKIRLRRERLDLRDIVGRCIEDLRSGFVSRGIELVACVEPTPVWVDGDATRLAQSVANLLNNAAKFTQPGGRVSVALRQEDSTASLEVEDTGLGIAPDMLERLFQPFAQADRTLDRSAGGLGLGLALVKGLVELHDGRVEAHSAGVGKGARFTLRLPAHPVGSEVRQPDSGDTREAETPHASVSEGQRRGRRILIIEDNVDAAQSLKETLELEQHEVAVAYAGPEGLQTARSFSPDVIFCDIGLPGMDGYDVARSLRSDPALSSSYLVAVTGYALPEDRRRAREAGFDQHLAKPLEFSSIEQVLADFR